MLSFIDFLNRQNFGLQRRRLLAQHGIQPAGIYRKDFVDHSVAQISPFL
jgi:hypothetical protein